MTIKLRSLLGSVFLSAFIMFQAGCGTSSLGTVSSTANPLVVAYSIVLPVQSQVRVEFGRSSDYGFTTSTQTAQAGVPLTILVAGMQQQTKYHMRAVITGADGTRENDSDHSFVTGSIPAGIIPAFSAETTGGATPQPGIEMINPVLGGVSTAFATDLAGTSSGITHFQTVLHCRSSIRSACCPTVTSAPF